VVTVTACPRHRHYAWRFVWAVLLWALALGCVWAVAMLWQRQPGGAPLWLVGVVIFVSLGVPFIFYLAYAGHGPVRVTAVRRDTVTLGHVRPAYFCAREAPR
jgi:hypothetical protein